MKHRKVKWRLLWIVAIGQSLNTSALMLTRSEALRQVVWLTSNSIIASNSEIGRSASAGTVQYIERSLEMLDDKKKRHELILLQAFGAAAGSERDAPDAGDRTGCYLWPGGADLARFVMRSPEYVKDRSVIELGTGTGAVGIAAHWAGAGKALLTDGSLASLALTRQNLNKNCCTIKGICPENIQVARLRWGYEEDLIGLKKSWQTVLAAEVGYERATLKALLATIDQLLDPKDGLAILQLTPDLADNRRGLAYVRAAISETGLTVFSEFIPSADEFDDFDDLSDASARFFVRPSSSLSSAALFT